MKGNFTELQWKPQLTINPEARGKFLAELHSCLSMQLLVICLLTVIRDIRRDHALAAVLPHRVYEVTFSPELSAPQLLLHLRCFRKHFARNYTLHRRDDPRRTVISAPIGSESVHGLDLILFPGRNLPALFNLNAGFPQNLVHTLTHHHSPILRCAHHMIHQHRYIVTFVDVTTSHLYHIPLSRSKLRGIEPSEIKETHQLS